MTAIQDFDIVQGRPARKTHSILARFQASGGKVAWEEITEKRACGTFSHPQGGSLEVEWTFDQAKKIGLTGKDNWKNYPKAMLRARCIAEGVRAVFPGSIGGMLSVEEAQDMAPKQSRDMGAAEVVHAEPPTELLQSAKEAAKSGVAAYEAFWKSAGKDNRTLLKDHHGDLKEIAINADKAAKAVDVVSVEEFTDALGGDYAPE